MKLRAIIALSSAALLTLVFALVSGAGPDPCVSGDLDLDGICDDNDNCWPGLAPSPADIIANANPNQRDDDEDGYGNLCDFDVDQDCTVGVSDVSKTFQRVPELSPWTPKARGAYDISDAVGGNVGVSDVSVIFGKVPTILSTSNSTRPCASCTATPTTGLGLGVCPGGHT